MQVSADGLRVVIIRLREIRCPLHVTMAINATRMRGHCADIFSYMLDRE